MTAHNHGAEDGPGLACPERTIDGQQVGECMSNSQPSPQTPTPEPSREPTGQSLHLLAQEFDEGRWEDRGANTTGEFAPSAAAWADELRTVANTLEELREALQEARDLANRWITASLESSPPQTDTFDPNSPESWSASVVRATLAIIEERNELRALVDSLRARLKLLELIADTAVPVVPSDPTCDVYRLDVITGGDLRKLRGIASSLQETPRETTPESTVEEREAMAARVLREVFHYNNDLDDPDRVSDDLREQCLEVAAFVERVVRKSVALPSGTPDAPPTSAVSLGTSGSSPTKPFVEPWPIRDFELAQLDADMEKEVADLSKTGHLLIVARRIIATLRHERESQTLAPASVASAALHVALCRAQDAESVLRETQTELAAARADAERIAGAIPKEDWHDDDGTVLWWTEAVGEPPHVGSPLDSDWADYDADYTHFTRIPNPKFPRAARSSGGT